MEKAIVKFENMYDDKETPLVLIFGQFHTIEYYCSIYFFHRFYLQIYTEAALHIIYFNIVKV